MVFGSARQVDQPWRRPWGELTSRATYRPDRQSYATLQRDDQAIIDEIDAAIEALLKTGACSALTIARAAAAEILGHHPVTGIKNRDLRYDAFWRMAGRKRYLPGLKDYGHPIADALQVSFWILQLDAETSIRAETAEEKRRRKCEEFLWTEKSLSSPKRGAPDGIMVTSDVGRELLCDSIPTGSCWNASCRRNGGGLPRTTLRPRGSLSRTVNLNSVSRPKKKERWHYDDDGVTNRMDHHQADAARSAIGSGDCGKLRLDRSGSDVTGGLGTAIATISELWTPRKSLFPQNRVFNLV